MNLREKLASDVMATASVKISEQQNGRVPRDAFNYPKSTALGAGLGGLLGSGIVGRMPVSPSHALPGGRLAQMALGGLLGAGMGGALGLQGGDAIRSLQQETQ
jgi:hypothetical protein